MAGAGHNSVAADRLRSFIERIERVNDEIAVLNLDRKEIFDEAKGEGFDVKVIRKILARRKRDESEVQEEEAVLDLYLSALGMV